MEMHYAAVFTVAFTSVCASEPKAPDVVQKKSITQQIDTAFSPEGRQKRKNEFKTYLQKQFPGKPMRISAPVATVADYWNCNRQYEAAGGDKRLLYKLVLEHVLLGEDLISQKQVEVQRSGLGVLLMAARCGDERIKDPRISLDLFEGWILPNLEVATPDHWVHLSREQLLKEAGYTFEQSKLPDKVIAVGRIWVNAASYSNSADTARLKIARALDQKGETEEAIAVLNEITNDSLPPHSLIAMLRKKLEMSK